MIRIKSKVKPAIGLDQVDKKILSGAPISCQQTMYFILRYTGCHVFKAAGIQHRDIDLTNGVFFIRSNDACPLKAPFNEREMPMIDDLIQVSDTLTLLVINQKLIYSQVYSMRRRIDGIIMWDGHERLVCLQRHAGIA